MEATTKKLEVQADPDIPPRLWAELVSAADQITAELFPLGTAALRIVHDHAIRDLNREFRDVDSATDVLSFPSSGGTSGHVGDIALSWDAVLRQSKINHNTPLSEAVALITHGLLHLAGYDHPDGKSQQHMDDRTRELLRTVNIEVVDFGH